MRFVTLFGLLMIASAINPEIIDGEMASTFIAMLVLCFLTDVYDFLRRKE